MSFTEKQQMLLELFQFEGIDVSLEISLFEYNVLYSPLLNVALFYRDYKEHENEENEEDRFCVQPWTDVECISSLKDLGAEKEFFSFTGLEEEVWESCRTVEKIFDLINYFGMANFSIQCHFSLEFCFAQIMRNAMKLPLERFAGIHKLDEDELADFFLQYSN